MLRLTPILLLCAPVMACGAFRNSRPALPDVILEVRNHSFFDVNVYALPSPASETRIRLGNVIGFETRQLRVPSSALRQGQSLALYLHAIGSNRSWVSPEVMVSPEVQPCLDIHSDLAGNLGMSVFYSRIPPSDSTNIHCGATRGSALMN